MQKYSQTVTKLQRYSRTIVTLNSNQNSVTIQFAEIGVLGQPL